MLTLKVLKVKRIDVHSLIFNYQIAESYFLGDLCLKRYSKGGELIELPSHNNNAVKTEMQSRTEKPKTKITKAQREELRLKFACRCAYCGCELKEKGWHADHVEPVRRDFDIVRAPQGVG